MKTIKVIVKDTGLDYQVVIGRISTMTFPDLRSVGEYCVAMIDNCFDYERY